MGNPSLVQLVDFLQSLSEGAKSDRGSGRARSAKSVLSGSFGAFKLDLASLKRLLGNPLIKASQEQGKWDAPVVREALPLPLEVVRKLEHACVDTSCDSSDRWLLAYILFMVWCSLRWSDAQRLLLDSLVLVDGSIRGGLGEPSPLFVAWLGDVFPRDSMLVGASSLGCNWLSSGEVS